MSNVDVGRPAPDFSRPAHDDRTISRQDLRGKPTVLYFYPRDNTPGCTTETKDFAALYPEFQNAGAEVVGISRDTLKSHVKFAEKLGLPFPLLADEDEIMCRAFGVMKEKNMFGKKVWGIERSTFILDAEGKVAYLERKVKVDGHAERMLEEVRKIK